MEDKIIFDVGKCRITGGGGGRGGEEEESIVGRAGQPARRDSLKRFYRDYSLTKNKFLPSAAFIGGKKYYRGIPPASSGSIIGQDRPPSSPSPCCVNRITGGTIHLHNFHK